MGKSSLTFATGEHQRIHHEPDQFQSVEIPISTPSSLDIPRLLQTANQPTRNQCAGLEKGKGNDKPGVVFRQNKRVQLQRSQTGTSISICKDQQAPK